MQLHLFIPPQPLPSWSRLRLNHIVFEKWCWISMVFPDSPFQSYFEVFSNYLGAVLWHYVWHRPEHDVTFSELSLCGLVPSVLKSEYEALELEVSHHFWEYMEYDILLQDSVPNSAPIKNIFPGLFVGKYVAIIIRG